MNRPIIWIYGIIPYNSIYIFFFFLGVNCPFSYCTTFRSIDALAGALQKYNGGVIIVSHNIHFVTNVATDLLVISKKNHTVKWYKDGSPLDYFAKQMKPC